MKVAVIPSDCRLKSLLNPCCSSGPQFSFVPGNIKDGERLSFHLPVYKQEWCSSAADSFVVWTTVTYYLLSHANFRLLVGGLKLNINMQFLFCTTEKCLWHHNISTWELPVHSLQSQPDKNCRWSSRSQNTFHSQNTFLVLAEISYDFSQAGA